MRGVLVIVVLVAACYSPSPPSGAPCPDNLCPAPQTCTNGFCRSPGEGGDDDAGGVDMIVVDAACGVCSTDQTQFVPCMGAAIDCVLGCSTSGGDHCVKIQPSNALDPSSTSQTMDVSIASDTTIDVDTGAITGGLTRAAGQGVSAGVRYTQVTEGGVEIGVFGVASLSLASGKAIIFKGTRAVAMISEGPILIMGTLDISAGCSGDDRSCPGPGGRPGARMVAAANGACSGGAGERSMTNADDGGGGGGGGGEIGANGGSANAAMAGTAGAGCIPATLVPLLGGGGGGSGGPGSSAFPQGGGGGGAIELVSQTQITIGGTINAGGDGGDGGHTVGGSSAGGGGGGGAGGGVLLEAPSVTVSGAIAANGGAGGGGGNSGAGPGGDGANGSKDLSVAVGGIGTAMPGPGNGGNGGASSTAPTVGGDGTNAGGGGGGRGAIRVNATTKSLGGTITPAATTGAPATK